MLVKCATCGKSYDDTYRLTYCPHEFFEMNTMVVKDGQIVGVAHSIEELDQMLAEQK